MMISRIAQSSIYNDTGILAYAVMSNHVHLVAQTEKESAFMKTLRSSYTQSFNHIYGRHGTLGEIGFFSLELDGIYHQQDALTYVLQNPCNHHVVDNPFDYPFSTMNLYFRRNNLENSPSLTDMNRSRTLLNRNVVFDAPIKYAPSGMIIPESFVQTKMVENIFGTYSAFHFLTHRRNYKEWKEKQQQESKTAALVNLHSMEPILTRERINEIEENSYKWKRNSRITDMELCQIIDERILKMYNYKSYVQLTPHNKKAIAERLLAQYPYKISEEQIYRCLG